MKFFSWFSPITLFIVGCAATLTYAPDYPLTTTVFQSRDGKLNAMVPRGWFVSHEDTLAPALQAWLIKEEFAASIAFRELHLDSFTSHRVENEGLKLLALVSFSYHQTEDRFPATAPEPKEFKLSQKKFCAYEVDVDKERKRIVVFSVDGKYYECEAAALKGALHPHDVADLFRAQQTVLASIR